MTRVMDGVRVGIEGTAARPSPLVRVVAPDPVIVQQLANATIARPAPLKPSAVRKRLPQGRLDGIRTQRTVQPTAKPPVPRATTPLTRKPMSDIMARPVAAPQVVMPRLTWAQRQLQLMHALQWRNMATGGALAIVALVASGFVVHSLNQQQTATARAEQSAVHLATATPVAPSPTPDQMGLQQLLTNFAAANPGMFSLYVKDLKTGQTATIDASRVMRSASLYKLFVAQRMFAQVDIGQTQLSKAAGGGTGQTIDGCLNLMITISDNGCGVALGTILGWGAQNQALSVEGYQDTDLASPQQTSARDVGALFERLYRGTLLSAASSTEFLGLLKNQRVNNRLPQGLPAGTVIAHKTGDLDGIVHDAGIVYGPTTDYLVVAMSGPWTSPVTAPTRFATLSQQLWNYFER